MDQVDPLISASSRPRNCPNSPTSTLARPSVCPQLDSRTMARHSLPVIRRVFSGFFLPSCIGLCSYHWPAESYAIDQLVNVSKQLWELQEEDDIASDTWTNARLAATSSRRKAKEDDPGERPKSLVSAFVKAHTEGLQTRETVSSWPGATLGIGLIRRVQEAFKIYKALKRNAKAERRAIEGEEIRAANA